MRASGEKARIRRRGFTLIEVLVTSFLVALALTGVIGGIGALTAAQVRARDADLLQRLTAQKWNEIGAVTDLNSADTHGDFAEQGYPDASWTMEVQTSGIENVDQVTITATRGESTQTLTGLAFVRPVTGSTGP